MSILRAATLAALMFTSANVFACPSLISFGGDPDGVIDSTPAWNQAMAAEVDCLFVPAGAFRFFTPPDPVKHGPVIMGESAGNSRLIRMFSGGIFIRIDGTAGGVLKDLSVVAESGTTGGIGIYLEVDADSSAHAWTLSGLHIGGWGSPLGTFFWPLYVWGTSHAGLEGWRNGRINAVTIFGMEAGSFYCHGCNSLRIDGLAIYGTAAKLWFQGGSRIIISGSDIQAPVQRNGYFAAFSVLGGLAIP